MVCRCEGRRCVCVRAVCVCVYVTRAGDNTWFSFLSRNQPGDSLWASARNVMRARLPTRHGPHTPHRRTRCAPTRVVRDGP